jgi:hypothetical protein
MMKNAFILPAEYSFWGVKIGSILGHEPVVETNQ